MNWLWIGGGIVALIFVAACIEAYFKRNRYRRLIDRAPIPRANTDDDLPISRTLELNARIERLNDTLTRGMRRTKR